MSYKNNRKMNRLGIHRKLVSALAGFVVFCTTYALILPAVTLDQDTASDDPGIYIESLEQEYSAPVEEYIEPDAYEVIEEAEEQEPAPDAAAEEIEETVFPEEAAETAEEPEIAYETDVIDEAEEPDELTGPEESFSEEPAAGDILTFFAEAGEISVSVEADAGAFPIGTAMTVCEVEEDDILDALSDVIDGEIAHIQAVDITFIDPEGSEIEPAMPIRVTLSTTAVEEAEPVIVHLDDEGEAEIIEQLEQDEADEDLDKADEIVFEAEAFSVYAIVYAVRNGAAAVTDGTAIDFEKYIKDVTLEVKPKGTNSWQSLASGGTVHLGDALRVSLSYEIPTGTLTTENKTITYTIPDNIRPIENSSGDVYDNNNDVIGTYTISTDGTISITFSDDTIEQNANSPIEGRISFHSSVDKIDAGEEGKNTITFSDDVKFDVYVGNDLNVSKTHTSVDQENGTAEYTITVSSSFGTDGKSIELTDAMGNDLVLDGSVTVKKGDADVTGYTLSTSADSKTFTITALPALAKGESYTITYRAKVDDYLTKNGKLEENNTVTAKTTGTNPLTAEDGDQVTFEHALLWKNGTKTNDTTVSWEIKINESKRDIGGWTLTDTNIPEGTTVTVDPAIDGETTITLPHTFASGTAEMYTLTYTTTVTGKEKNVSNTAILTPPGSSSGISAGAIVPITSSVTKTGQGVTINGDGTADFSWQILISGPVDLSYTTEYGQAWVLNDEIWHENIQWITGAQIKTILSQLNASPIAGNFTLYGYKWSGTGNKYQYETIITSDIADDAKFGQFRIVSTKELTAEESITLNYATTVDIKDGRNTVEVGNNEQLWGQYGDTAYQSYRPIVTKVDKHDSTGSAVTYYVLNDDTLKLEKGSDTYQNVMWWLIEVSLDGVSLENDLIVTETLPDGTELLDSNSGEWNFSFIGWGNFGFTGRAGDQTTYSHKWSDTEVTAVREGQKITVTVPSKLLKYLVEHDNLTKIWFEVRAVPTESWTGVISRTYANNVTVTTGDSKIGETTQTQVISQKLLTKSEPTQSNQELAYTVDINPEGLDIAPGSDTITVTDVLTFSENTDANAEVSLMVDRVKLFYADTNTEVPSNQWSWKEEIDGDQYKLIVTAPDSAKLRFQYSYWLLGTANSTMTVSNTIYMQVGQETIGADTRTTKNVHITSSDASASATDVTFYKVDADNFATRLPNAVFQLYKYDSDAKSWVEEGDPYTNDKGAFNLSFASNSNLKANTPYKLVETTAPDGYELDDTPL